jgi:type IV pilus assembly protein PilW
MKMDTNRLHHCTGTRRDCRGVGIVELMVAMLISLILLAGVAQIYLGSKKSYLLQDSLGRLQENGRYALETLVQDLRRAGYLGGNADISTIIGGSLGISPNATTCATGDMTWGLRLNRRIYGLDDTNAGYACIPDSAYTRGDVLVVRYAAPWLVGSTITPIFEAKRPYLRTALFEGRMFTGEDEADSTNVVARTPNRTGELIAHAYYVGPSNVQCDGTTVPALYRETLDANGRPAAEEVILGLDNFQVQYGVDGDGDNSIERYYDADNVPNWDDVIAARVWLLMRAECPETAYTNNNTYTMGDQNYAVNDGYRRQLYSSTVRLRNRIF